jgi:phosphate-selective porin
MIAMRWMRVLVALVLSIVPLLPARAADDDAAAVRELRSRIERQAAELDALRAEVTRLETKLAGPAPPAPIAKAPEVKSAPVATSAALTSSNPVVFSGIVQGWATADTGAANNTFRIRRSELKMTGVVTRGVGWAVMIDPAKVLSSTAGTINQASRILQDAYLTLPVRGGATLTVGQIKLPFALEGLAAPIAVDTVERALFASDRARGGSYGDIRDIGVSVKGTVRKRYDYQAGFFNGLGENQNDVDHNDRKAVVGRFVARLAGGLQLGASGAHDGDLREHVGAELLLVRGPFQLKAEAIQGRDDLLHRRGGYLHAGYRLTPRFELVGRIDTWDPDTSRDGDLTTALERDYIAGFNLKPRERLRLQVNAVRKTFEGGPAARNLLMVNLDTVW